MIQQTKILTPNIVAWLQRALEKAPASVDTIENVISSYLEGTGKIYLIGDKAAMFLQEEVNPRGKDIINLFLLGGSDVWAWRQELEDFFVELTKRENKELVVIGRESWGRVFPILKKRAIVYTLG